MKKIISVLLIFSTLSCFTMAIGSLANDSTVASNSSIVSIWEEVKDGLGTVWNGTTYGLERAWNGTKYGTVSAYDWTKDTTFSIGNWFINMWCEYIGLGCQNNTNTQSEL